MARIRTIKPEFPQSESMGRVSRDARLTFIELWTLADDEGRLRGNARMLAGILFPYDDDAPNCIEGWLVELEREGCIRRYRHADSHYLWICHWKDHQKIDKPSRSKLPDCTITPDFFAIPREDYGLDQGEDQGRDQEVDPDLNPSPNPVAVGPAAPSATVPAPAQDGPATDPVSGSMESVTAGKQLTPLQAACRATWKCYADAYLVRYGAVPVRNARINAQIQHFVQRLGREAAPLVATFYLQHDGPLYLRAAHSVGLMLSDAEKLHTEWTTGRPLPQPLCALRPGAQQARQIAAGTRLGAFIDDAGRPLDMTGDAHGIPASLLG